MYIDAHCHLADARFDGIRADVMSRARRKGVTRFLQGGVNPQDWARQSALADPSWLLSFGLHPYYVNYHDEASCALALSLLESQLADAVALGELGMDHGPRMNRDSFARQKYVFEQQLHMSQRHKKPLVLHLVGCHGLALTILKRIAPQWRGMVHGFSGSRQVAEAYQRLGLLLSVGGVVARPGYKKLKSALSHIPNQSLVVESDAPDRAPAAYQRSLNEPESIHQVAEAVAEIRGQTPALVLTQSAANLCRIFALEP